MIVAKVFPQPCGKKQNPLIVGPSERERKVLRQTDGERFVAEKKHNHFLRKIAK